MHLFSTPYEIGTALHMLVTETNLSGGGGGGGGKARFF